jgi:hypothetical protein
MRPFATRMMCPMTTTGHPSTEPHEDAHGLGPRLSAIAGDRASSAARLVLETAGIVRRWVHEHADGPPLTGSMIEAGLVTWAEEQAWRGPCALLLDTLRRTWHVGSVRGPRAAAEALAEELSGWLDEDERDGRGELRERPNRRSGSPARGPWNGEPLAPGRRLPSRLQLAEKAATEIAPGDRVLVTSYSETVVAALEAAWRAGQRPEVLLGEGAPDLDGRRVAQRLSRSGIRVTLAYDSAVLGLVPRADRVWLASEAIGAGLFLARSGTRTLLEECARRDVPVRVLATSDKLVPGGALRLPAWCERESWLLWDDAPEGVRLESQMFEFVPLDLLELVGGLFTERGPEAVAPLHLRALRVEAAPPCDTVSNRVRALTT